jgi:mRNA interferase MazF
VSRTVRGIPSEVPLGARDGLPAKCVANADNLVTIPKTWLSSRLSQLSSAKLAALDEALRFALGM